MRLLAKFGTLSACLVFALTGMLGAQSIQGLAGQQEKSTTDSKYHYSHIAVGGLTSCAMTETDGLKCWGANGRGQVGDGTGEDRYKPVDVIGLDKGVRSVTAGAGHTCVLMKSGNILCWGRGDYGELGAQWLGTASPGPVDDIGDKGLGLFVAAGSLHTCAIIRDAGVKCWGSNTFGELGIGNTDIAKSFKPVDVVGLKGETVSLSLGHFYGCAINTKRRVQCWGMNLNGQLGDGTTIDRYFPVDVPLGGVVAISAMNQTCALTNVGDVYCWGYNHDGQVGDGTTTDRLLPVKVLSGAVSVSTGEVSTCALMKTGRMKCWGYNYNGELGNGTWRSSKRPVDVIGPAAVEVNSKDYHSCARTTRGKIVCWGYGSNGALGIGTTFSNDRGSENTPVQVKGF